MKKVEIGAYLRRVRKAKGFTLREAAKRSGVSHPYLSQLENGKNDKPSPEILRKLSSTLDVSYLELMTKAGYNDYEGYSLIEAFGGVARSTPQNKTFDIHAILNMNADVYFQDKLLNKDDKEFLVNLLERTFGNN